MSIDEKKNHMRHICALTKLTVILINGARNEVSMIKSVVRRTVHECTYNTKAKEIRQERRQHTMDTSWLRRLFGMYAKWAKIVQIHKYVLLLNCAS